LELNELIDKLDVQQDALVQALLEQPKLFWEVSKIKAEKLRERASRETACTELVTTMSLAVRKSFANERITEGAIKERVETDPKVRMMRRRVDSARAVEDYVKGLLEAYYARGSMCRALVQLIAAEASVDSLYWRDEMERMGVGKLSKRFKKQ